MSKKILIIDDEQEVIDVLEVRLQSAGFETVTASDGEEGLKKIAEGHPDLILMDVMMPKLNGYQVCRELKKNETTKGIPIIMLTAKTQESDKFWGEECGADAYVTKPVEPEDLLAKVEEFLK